MTTNSGIAENRRAFFEYEITERFEAGIVLTGPEIKAIRGKHADISASYARVVGGEVWLINSMINGIGIDNKTRSRKLLLHQAEINRLIGLAEQKGLAVIPLRLFFKKGKVKAEIGVGRGRKLHDKREVIKKRDQVRELRKDPGTKS